MSISRWFKIDCGLLQSPDQGQAASRDPLLQQLMGVKLHSDMKCQESEESLAEDSVVFALKCNITIDVNHLSEGLHKGLEDDREKNSEQLGRLALFKVNLQTWKFWEQESMISSDNSSLTCLLTDFSTSLCLVLREIVHSGITSLHCTDGLILATHHGAQSGHALSAKRECHEAKGTRIWRPTFSSVSNDSRLNTWTCREIAEYSDSHPISQYS